ncbi:MAG: TAXI family TRAP transporter solute-binding subunit [Clostridium sp.]|nr:TAXI family TRAP transporter solute-binding subunit [Clostridiaceae bacterium]MDY5484446.1 TAXI family TRAP transporter solute-binding subunit [Clostridium sp.]
MKKIFRGSFIAMLLTAVLGISGCITEPSYREASGDQTGNQTPIRVLTIGTADTGGTMYPVGCAIAEAINSYNNQMNINLGASTGSFENVRGLSSGQFDLGLVTGDVAYAAYNGTKDFEGHAEDGLRAIGALYTSTSNWMVPEASGLVYVHDLAGKRIAVGPEGSTTEYSARISLTAAGLTPANTAPINCGIGYGSEEVKKGTMDAVHGFAGIPVSGLSSLAEAVPCRLLIYSQEELEEILDSNPIYQKVVIPARTYRGQTEDVNSFGIQCLLCVSESMDESLAYTIAKILDQAVPELIKEHPTLRSMEEPGYMCNQLPIPLHAGAKRYYKEKGSLKP